MTPRAGSPASLIVLAAALCVAGLGGCGRSDAPAPATAPGAAAPAAPAGAASATHTPGPSDYAELERANGLMGRFDFAAARDAYARLASRFPDWYDARIDLAIATLNRQQEGDEPAAQKMLADIRLVRPDDVNASYLLGVTTLHSASPKAAEPLLRGVTERDPKDAYAQYFLAQSVLAQGRTQEALEHFERAIALDPRLRSALYGASQALARLGRVREAEARLAEFESQRNNPLAHLAEFKYTRMGPRSEVVSTAPPAVPYAAPKGPLFAAAETLLAPSATAPRSSPVASAADIDGDGEMALFLAGGRGAESRVLLRRGNGYEDSGTHPLAQIRDVEFAAWGDIDNDGLVDVLLCRADASPLVVRQSPRGVWHALNVPALRKVGEASDCALFDADHDGDLDILIVTKTGRRVLLANNGDRTFRSLNDRLPRAPSGAASQIVVADLDNDRDLDILVLHRDGPHEILANDLLWRWHPASGFDDFVRTPALAAVAVDLEQSGNVDLLTLTPRLGVLRWKRSVGGRWISTAVVPDSQPPAAGVRAQLGAADLDGDGRPEIIASSSAGATVWRMNGDRAERVLDIPEATLASWMIATLDDKGPALVTYERDGTVSLRRPGPGRAPFARLMLSGRNDPAASIRSNASGIGARVAARVGGRSIVTDNLRPFSGPGQSLTPLAIGLDGATQIDYASIEWPDGVLQTELALAPGGVHRIAETQRQLSSCPVMFAWDGKRYRFVSDILGVGGLGFLLSPGEYVRPRPWENFLLPEGLLQPQDGHYAIKIGEPMEETAYVDSARLVAYDLPPGWQMALDERMETGRPRVTGRPFYFQRELLPARAFNDRDEDVTAVLSAADLKAADPGERDDRFIGYLRREHVLTLEFASDLDAGPGAPLLVADGWLEYPYAQTMFAAWQAHAAYAAPTLEARGRDGRWRVVLEAFGYPAGMPRRMSVPLPKLPAGTRALRLRTTQEIYWDRIAVAWAEDAPAPRHALRHVLPMARAEMSPAGFPKRTTGAQRQPDYDYEHRAPLWDTRTQSGYYTAFGRVDALVAEADDALAVIGPGEELQLDFTAALPALPPGWSRRFVLETQGWAKDMDLYTLNGEAVGPLPTSGKPHASRDRLNRQYNTRFASGR